ALSRRRGDDSAAAGASPRRRPRPRAFAGRARAHRVSRSPFSRPSPRGTRRGLSLRALAATPTFRRMEPLHAVRWSDDGTAVRILDQRQLPANEVWRDLRTVDEVCDAISTLAVRGAPAIGIAGAMGLALAAGDGRGDHLEFVARCRESATRI